MHGPGAKAGSVGGIEDIAHPISVARAVMEKTPHVMLVGEGAKKIRTRTGIYCKEPSHEQTTQGMAQLET